MSTSEDSMKAMIKTITIELLLLLFLMGCSFLFLISCFIKGFAQFIGDLGKIFEIL